MGAAGTCFAQIREETCVQIARRDHKQEIILSQFTNWTTPKVPSTHRDYTFCENKLFTFKTIPRRLFFIKTNIYYNKRVYTVVG